MVFSIAHHGFFHLPFIFKAVAGLVNGGGKSGKSCGIVSLISGRLGPTLKCMIPTLKEELAEWTDFDLAGLYAARCLGIFASDITTIRQVKHVFWSAHPVGESIVRLLNELVKAGVLEYDEEDLRFRWNQAYRGSWES
jgi:hypothetical protein